MRFFLLWDIKISGVSLGGIVLCRIPTIVRRELFRWKFLMVSLHEIESVAVSESRSIEDNIRPCSGG
jgi:hypothetical protein